MSKKFDYGPFDLNEPYELENLGLTFQIDELRTACRLPRMAQKRWVAVHLGDKTEAGKVLERILDHREWRPQDLAHALNETGHKIRRHIRGETAFDATFLLNTLEAISTHSIAAAADNFWALQGEAVAERIRANQKSRQENGEPDSMQDATQLAKLEAIQARYRNLDFPNREADVLYRQVLREEGLLRSADPRQPTTGAPDARIEKMMAGFRREKAAQVVASTKDKDGGWTPAKLVGFNRDPIPLYGKVSAGLGEDISNVTEAIDLVDPPPACKGPDCYAVFISGDSMEPVMRAGMVAYCAPSLPVRARDYVVVQMLPKASADGIPQEAYIKEFKSLTDVEDGVQSVLVRQYNPPKDVKLENVDQIHRVVAVEFV